MNHLPDVEPILRAYLAETGDRAPDRVLTDVAARIARQPRSAWRLRGRPFMNTRYRLVAGLAAILIVGVVGWQLLPRQNGVGPGVSPSPTTAPTPTAAAIAPSPTSPQCEDLIPGCAGVLQAGVHSTAAFEPTFTYTTPAGWINPIDAPTLFALSTSYELPDPILVWSQIVPADRGADCVLKAKAGATATVDGWVAYLTSHPGLTVSNKHETTLAGLRAVVVDLQSNLTWATPCADDAPSHGVPIIRNVGNTPGDGYGTGEGGRIRLYIVGAGATTVLVTIYSYGGGDAAFNSMLPQVEPIVQSFRIAVPPASQPPSS